MSDITYSWNEYIRLNEELVYKVAKSGWQFDCLICLSRGGMRPGDFFSRIYGKASRGSRNELVPRSQGHRAKQSRHC